MVNHPNRAKAKAFNWLPNHPNTGNWKERHTYALVTEPVARMIREWLRYADNHNARYDSPIGQDYILGDAWARQGFAIRELLNGELGGLDAGTLDSILCDHLERQGWDTDTEERRK